MKKIILFMSAALVVACLACVACKTEYKPKYKVALDGNATGAVDVTFDSGKGHFAVDGEVGKLAFEWGSLEEQDSVAFAAAGTPMTLDAWAETATEDEYESAVAVRDAALQAVQVVGEAGATYRLHVVVYFQEPVTGAVLAYEDEFVSPLKEESTAEAATAEVPVEAAPVEAVAAE